MRINVINTIKNNIQTSNLNSKKHYIDYTIQDSVSFGRKNKSNAQPTYGISYDVLSDMNIKRTKTVPELKKAFKNGEDISEERDKLIISRIPIAIKDANRFCAKHKEFNPEDITQDLIGIIIEKTDRTLEDHGDDENLFGPFYKRGKELYFQRLLKPQIKMVPLDSKMPNEEELYEIVERSVLKEYVNTVLDRIGPSKKRIIEQTYDLNDKEQQNLTQIAKIRSVTPQAVGQARRRAFQEIKESKINRRILEGYISESDE